MQNGIAKKELEKLLATRTYKAYLSKRKYVSQIPCPSCEGDHWIDVYEEDGKLYTLCFGVDIEPYPLTDYDIKYWNIKPVTTTTPHAE